jgi:hypothetical protein
MMNSIIDLTYLFRVIFPDINGAWELFDLALVEIHKGAAWGWPALSLVT